MAQPGPRLDVEIDGLPYKLNLPPEHLRRPNEPIPKDVYDVVEVEPLLTRIGTGVGLNYADFPSSTESIVADEDWTKGLSPTRLMKLDATYWTALGVDARRPGQLILQPQATVVPFASNPTAAATKQVDFVGNAYCIAGGSVWKLNPATPRWNAVLTPGSVTQAVFSDLAVFNNLLLACAVAPTGNIDSGSGGTVTYTGTTLTDTSKAWTVNQWIGRIVTAGSSVGVVFSNTATVLTLYGTGWSGGTPAAGTAYAIDYHLAYWTSLDGTAWTQSLLTATADAAKADLFAVVRFQLWKAVKPNKIYSCTDPTNGAGTTNTWTSTATFIGDQARNITAIGGYHIDVAIAKEDGLWTVDRAGNDYPILPEMATVTDPDNGKNMKVWRTGLMLKVRNGVWRYEGGRLLSLGLDRYRAAGVTGTTGIVLRAVDQAPYLNELFVVHKAQTGANAIYLLSLHENPWRWHCIFYQTGFKPTHLAVSAAAFSFPSLWVGRDNGSGTFDTIYLRLPNGTDNPLDDTGYLYDTGTTNRLTTVELSPLPDQDKFWTKYVVHVLAGGAAGAGTLAVDYSVDPATDPATIVWTPMVGPQLQTTQPLTLLYQEWFFGNPPTPDGAPALAISKSLIFRFTLTTTVNTSTPVIKHSVLHFKHRPQARLRWKAQLVCEDKARGDRFFEDGRMAEQQLTDLLQSRVSTPPVKWVDLLGITYDVVMEKVDHHLIEKLPGGGRRYAVDVQMLQHLGTFNPALPPRSTP